ncbi:MAG: hypothetical protein ACREKS_09530 [Candidatus Rokuibacteriota bacterium]
MPRYLFIVARGRPDVYADLQRQFLGNPEVEVLVDRRLSERREHQESHQPERRRGERRGQRGGSSHVRGIGGDPSLSALIVELAPGAPSSTGAD